MAAFLIDWMIVIVILMPLLIVVFGMREISLDPAEHSWDLLVPLAIVVAILQGTLGGLMFWFLGIRAALLWAALMALLSLLPAVGAALVWFPVALYLLATGAIWQGLVLIAFGVLVIGLVDNLLRPLLVGTDIKMPDYVVLLSTLGGIEIFGMNGIVLGPLIAAMMNFGIAGKYE